MGFRWGVQRNTEYRNVNTTNTNIPGPSRKPHGSRTLELTGPTATFRGICRARQLIGARRFCPAGQFSKKQALHGFSELACLAPRPKLAPRVGILPGTVASHRVGSPVVGYGPVFYDRSTFYDRISFE